MRGANCNAAKSRFGKATGRVSLNCVSKEIGGFGMNIKNKSILLCSVRDPLQ